MTANLWCYVCGILYRVNKEETTSHATARHYDSDQHKKILHRITTAENRLLFSKGKTK